MQDAGIRLTNHTDAPAAVLWPWWGMEASLTRAFPEKPERGTLGKEQALKIDELIEIYTINSAWALQLDQLTGSIEVGKSADMIVLNHNLFEVESTDIHDTQVLKTIFKGVEIYHHE
jgi:predicted amidohydrolase YtcJ